MIHRPWLSATGWIVPGSAERMPVLVHQLNVLPDAFDEVLFEGGHAVIQRGGKTGHGLGEAIAGLLAEGFLPFGPGGSFNHRSGSLLLPGPGDRWARGRFQHLVGEKLYVVGGHQGFDLSTVEAYDPATNTWSTVVPLPMPRAMAQHSAA